MRILLLSAYDAMSHRQWREGMVAAFPEHDWSVLSLPPRFFSWRIRGNSMTWAFSDRGLLEAGYDLLLATSMTDVASLKGMVPALASVPTIVYFHENQFAYPQSDHQLNSVEPQMVNLYSALAADQLAFNSQYNLDSFIAGVTELLAKLPDHVPPGLPELLLEKSTVLPVPLEPDTVTARQPLADRPIRLLWNHRWEYDKGPEGLYLLLIQLKARGIQFTIDILGQQFRQSPDVFALIQELFGHCIGHWGYLESREDYLECLSTADVVLSTSLHDFQGLSMLEAVTLGCVPLVPDRLAYPELFAPEYRYESLPADKYTEAKCMADKLQAYVEQLPAAPNVENLLWPSLRSDYQNLFDRAGQASTEPV